MVKAPLGWWQGGLARMLRTFGQKMMATSVGAAVVVALFAGSGFVIMGMVHGDVASLLSGGGHSWAQGLLTLTETVRLLCAVVGLLAIVALLPAGVLFARYIGTRLETMASLLELVREGDLTQPVPHFSGQDETTRLADAVRDMVDAWRGVAQDMNRRAADVSSGGQELVSSVQRSREIVEQVRAAVLKVADAAG
jgi:methyl-accepting chemotaxis protein